MEGYDYEVVGDDILEYKCPICLMLLREAMLLPCSHSACKDCLTQWEQHGDADFCRCPSCQTVYQREQVYDGKQGKFIDRIVTTSLKVKCKQHLLSCEWIGTISEYCEIHKKSCIYEPMSCDFPGCDIKVARKNLKSHQKSCEYRVIQCNYCMETFPFNQLQQHHVICDYYDVTCKQGCGGNFKRKDVPTHIVQECPNTVISCPYHVTGCIRIMRRRDLVEHMKDASHEHSNYLLYYTMKLSNEVRDLKETNEVLKVEMQEHKESSSMKLSHLEGKLEEKEKEIHALNYELSDIKYQMSQGGLKKCNEEILRMKNEIEKRFSDHEMKMVVIRTLSIEDCTKNWSFEELRDLIEIRENDIFDGIIKLRPERALLRDSCQSSLLHFACNQNNIACVDILLDNGCNPNCENDRGIKPIHNAAIWGSVDAAKKLLSVDGNLINIANNKTKRTPLHYAAHFMKEDFVKYLLTQPGIQVNLRDSDDTMADEYNFGSYYKRKRIQKMIREYRDNHL